MSSKRPFRYDAERREEAHRRRLRAIEFPSLVERAARHGDTETLRDYLLSSDPLSKEHRALLADLIYRCIQRKGKGKRGDPAPRPLRDAAWRVAYEVRGLQKARGWMNLSKARRAVLIEEAGEALAEAGIFDDIDNDSRGQPVSIPIAEVESALRTLGRRPVRS